MVRKIAATFSSIGLLAIYLNPLDALHGDLGIEAPVYLVLLLSVPCQSSCWSGVNLLAGGPVFVSLPCFWRDETPWPSIVIAMVPASITYAAQLYRLNPLQQLLFACSSPH